MIDILLNNGQKLNLVSFSFPSHLVLNAENFNELNKIYALFLTDENLTRIIVSDDGALLTIVENATLEGAQMVKDNNNYYLHIYLDEHKNLTVASEEELKAERAENYVKLFGNNTKDITERTEILQNKIVQLAQKLSDEDALNYKEFYKNWDGKSVQYAQDDKVRYGEILYKCLSAHTSQESWSPTNTPSLWSKILVSETGAINEWEQPNSTNPYQKGDKVRFNGKIYESLINNNVWQPTVAGTESLWKLVESES